MFIPATKSGKPTDIPTKTAEAAIEIHPVTLEDKISKCSAQYKTLQNFFVLLTC